MTRNGKETTPDEDGRTPATIQIKEKIVLVKFPVLYF